MVGFWGNLVLAVLKGIAGVLANSSAMIADAVHSASDIFASLFVYISLKIASKPADEDHPYGHGKAEVISTLIVGIMLAAAGIQIIVSAIAVIRHGNISAPGNLAVYAAVFSIIIKELMYRFTYRAGVRSNSPATIANAKDHRSDAFSSIAALFGIIGAKLAYPVLDPAAGIIVAFFIFKMSYDIVMDALGQIMDESPGQKMIDQIKQFSLIVNGVRSVHDIRVRRSGAVYLIDLDIVVDPEISVKQAHDIADQVRDTLLTHMENILEIRVHVDPCASC